MRSGAAFFSPAFCLNFSTAELRFLGAADLERVPPAADLECVPPAADLEREDEPGRDECAIKLPVT